VTAAPLKLFEPIMIGSHRVRNRIAMSAMNDNLATPDGVVTQTEVDYYEARAAGGVGLLVTGNAFIDADVSKISATQLGAHSDRLVAGLGRLAEAVQNQGALLIVQLAHAGPQTLPETIGHRQTVAPSATLFADPSRELGFSEIQSIVVAFAAAAARVDRVGGAGVEVHCGHGYLLSAFLSPNTNQRTDGYGGSLEGRMRIVREIFAQIRAVTRDGFIIGAKFNASDLVEGGLTHDEGVLVAQALENAGADYLSVSRGVGDSVDLMISPLYYPRHGNIAATRVIKDAVSIPVIAAGSIHDPVDAEAILQRGDADLVAIGRSLIADPQWPQKAKLGLDASIRPCIRCNECVALVDENRELRCAVNPLVGRDAARLEPAAKPQHVVVVGGGPAGCEAARVAALRGHRVTLLERRGRLGGASVPRNNPDFKRELNRLPVWYEDQLAQSGVAVTLGHTATVESVSALDPDVVVYAVGAAPMEVAVPGAKQDHVVQAVDLLETEQGPDRDVVVVGAGFVGCETATFLGRSGNRVRLITRRGADEIAGDLNHTVRLALLRLMEEAKVEVVGHCDLAQVTSTSVVVTILDDGGGSTFELPADLVVLSRGFTPSTGLADGLRAAGFDVRMVGQSVSVGLILNAVHQGFAAGSTV
jgi:2,4-dienoyl-CoA reductase-like NADH-dependent reductase (Old Yellow Enzyme family)/thioredoxin reductase